MSNFKDIFEKEVPEKQIIKLSFDVDSSPIAWKAYEKVYNLKIEREYLELAGKSDAERLCLMLSKVDLCELKKVFGIENKPLLEKKFKIAGDCAFNFNETKVEKLKKKIRNGKNAKCNKDKVERELEKCKKFHHSVLNFSLMPVTGGLNNEKNFLNVDNKVDETDLDRFDTFIYCLDKDLKYINKIKGKYKDCKDDLLKKENSFISNSILGRASKKNFLAAYNFFCNYKDAREYCNYFYHLDDDHLLNDLKENGKKPICNADDVNNYIKLANRYWEQQEKYIESLPCDAHRKVIELLKAI